MTNPSTIGRRSAIGLGLATGAAAIVPRRARAQAVKEVNIAMLVPLSGPWARQGILEKFGAEMAIDDINKAGGIKSMGGAKLKLLEYDTGDTAEKAKDAAQRLLAQEPSRKVPAKSSRTRRDDDVPRSSARINFRSVAIVRTPARSRAPRR